MSCCISLCDSEGVISPFSLVVVLDYWDGPVSGLVQCGACNRSFSFVPLFDMNEDTRWLRAGEPRVYALRALSEDAYGSIISLLECGSGKAEGPVWVPSPPPGWNEGKAEEVARLISEASRPVMAIASVDLSEAVLKAIPLTSTPNPSVDYYKELGL